MKHLFLNKIFKLVFIIFILISVIIIVCGFLKLLPVSYILLTLIFMTVICAVIFCKKTSEEKPKDNNNRYCFGINIDNSEKKKDIERLRESESRFRTIIEFASVGITLVNMKGKVIKTNKAFMNMLGCSRDDIENHNISEYIHPDNIQEVHDAMLQLKEKKIDSVRFRKRIKQSNGNYIWVESSSILYFHRDVRPAYYINHHVNANSQVKYEIELKELNNKANKLNEELALKTKELEIANNEMQTILYSVSHDLRTPLRSINGFSQALYEDCYNYVNIHGKDYILRIQKNVERMSNLIDELIEFSRLARSSFNRVNLNISDIAMDIIDMYKAAEPARVVDTIIQPNVQAYADPVYIRTVLENLLNNAWKFTSKKQNAVIEFGAKEIDGIYTYYVKDNGAGFNMAHSDKLFGVFNRLHTMEEFPGTGIGLVSVQRIIQRHNGKIWTEAEVNKGATFYFFIPKEKKQKR